MCLYFFLIVGHDMPSKRNCLNRPNGNLFQYSCLENPMDRGVWQTAVHGVANSWTQLSNWYFLPCSMWWWGVGRRKVLLWLRVSLLVSLCLWTINFTSTSSFFPPSLGGAGWLEGPRVGYSPSPRSVRFCLMTLPWEQALFRTSMKWKSLSPVDSLTPWIVWSTGFSRPEY